MTPPIRVAHIAGVDLTHRFLLLNQLCHLRDEGYEVTAISAPGPYADELEARGIRHVPWPHITRAWDPTADVRAMRALIGILKRERFDLVHTHNPKPGFMGRVAARMAGVPCVVNTVHGLYAMPEDSWRKRAAVLGLERIAARFSHHELYQSAEDLEWARRLGIVSPSRSELLGNGADLSFFDPRVVSDARRVELRRELGVRPDELVVGTVGRLVAEKGYRELFAAARQVRTSMPSVRFLVVGSPDPDKLDAIRENEIAQASDDVIFAGWRQDVRDLMAVMDVFVLASYREGVPRSAIEAAAMGRPMVLTDIRGCREVVRDGVEGLLVRPRDSGGLAEAIGSLLGDEMKRREMGSAARARAADRFDENRVLGMLDQTYERLLTGKGVASLRDESVRIRPARVADTPILARLHRRSLPDAFLPTLGEPFLRRLYRALASDPGAVTMVAETGGQVVGFATGVRSVRTFYRRFCLRHGVSAGLVAIPHLLRPSALRRVYETARYPTTESQLPDSELLSIAVAPGCRSRGVGKELADRMLRGLAELGVGDVKVVVAAANDQGNRFYDRIGFQPLTTIAVHDGTPSNVWIFRCSS